MLAGLQNLTFEFGASAIVEDDHLEPDCHEKQRGKDVVDELMNNLFCTLREMFGVSQNHSHEERTEYRMDANIFGECC